MRTTVKRGFVMIACMAMIAGCSGTAAPATASPSAAAPAASPSASSAPTASPIAAPTSLIKPGELSNCVDIEYSPMEFFAPTDPTKPVGFDVEAYQAVVKEFGLTEKIVNTAFDGLIPALQAGRYWMTSRLAGSRLYFVASAARVPSSFSALSAAVSAVPTSVLPLPK